MPLERDQIFLKQKHLKEALKNEVFLSLLPQEELQFLPFHLLISEVVLE